MTGSAQPVLHVVAGPNGSGKSTFVDRFLAPTLGPLMPFVNADLLEVASAEVGETIDSYAASGIAAEVRARLIAARRSFIAETVFSHPSKVELVRTAVDAGYLVTVHVLMVPVELAVARVRVRVADGGHDVPEDKIRGRHARLWRLVADGVELADEAIAYDASGNPRVAARWVRGELVGSPTWPAWAPDELVMQV